MRILFPTNPQNLNNYPNLSKVFSRAATKSSSAKQIFRLLDNLHMPKAQRIIRFLESLLDINEHYEFIKNKLNSADSLQFLNYLSELFLLNRHYRIKPFETSKSQGRVPEFHAQKDSDEFLFELYSPVELYGYQEFFDELRTSLKYLDVNYGFDAKINVIHSSQRGPFDPNALYFPYEIHSKYVNNNVRKLKISDILKVFDDCAQKCQNEFDMRITKDVALKFKIKLFQEKDQRIISTISTHSASISTYFEFTPCTAKGFYRNLFNKIRLKQLDRVDYPSAIKIFLIDFNHTEDGYSLVSEMGKGYHSKKFYENLSKCLNSQLKNSTVDLVYSMISGIYSDFIIGKCVYNPNGILLPF